MHSPLVPRTSANKLAEFITAKTPRRREAIIREHLRRQHLRQRKLKTGHAPWYQAFKTPARSFLLSRARNEKILHDAIAAMKTRVGRPWLDIDSRITAEALRALLALGPELRALPVEYELPSTKPPSIHFGELAVTATPDLMVRGKRGGKPLVGALRFYLAKESTYQLSQRGAELVAALEYLWLIDGSSGTPTPDADLCFVVQCFQKQITSAPPDMAQAAAALERGAAEFVKLWHALENEEAA